MQKRGIFIMLLVWRKVLQKIKIRGDITLTVLNIKENKIQFVLDAPLNIIEPLEHIERLKAENSMRIKRTMIKKPRRKRRMTVL
jgi:sRNA-binding carbon storage regulator CsrA